MAHRVGEGWRLTVPEPVGEPRGFLGKLQTVARGGAVALGLDLPFGVPRAYAAEREGEVWMFNCYIPEYQGGVLSRFEPRAPRKLLLKKKQINSLLGAVTRQGATLVPLQIHFNDQGRAKVLLGVGEGRKKADKRHAIAARDWQRDKARLMRGKG